MAQPAVQGVQQVLEPRALVLHPRQRAGQRAPVSRLEPLEQLALRGSGLRGGRQTSPRLSNQFAQQAFGWEDRTGRNTGQMP